MAHPTKETPFCPLRRYPSSFSSSYLVSSNSNSKLVSSAASRRPPPRPPRPAPAPGRLHPAAPLRHATRRRKDVRGHAQSTILGYLCGRPGADMPSSSAEIPQENLPVSVRTRRQGNRGCWRQRPRRRQRLRPTLTSKCILADWASYTNVSPSRVPLRVSEHRADVDRRPDRRNNIGSRISAMAGTWQAG